MIRTTSTVCRWSRTSPRRALAKDVEIVGAVPTKWHKAVAEVLALVYKVKKAA
jgi:flagellar biosynthesis protein FlhB